MKPTLHPSRSHTHRGLPAQLRHNLVTALAKLKTRLVEQYEQALPGRSQIVRQAVAEAEELAWATPFPHLFLPDFAEARLAKIVAVEHPELERAA